MIYPLLPGFPDAHAASRARGPRSHRGGRRVDGFADEGGLGLVVRPGPAPQAPRRRRLRARGRRPASRRVWPRPGVRCSRSGSPTASARASGHRRATPCSPTRAARAPRPGLRTAARHGQRGRVRRAAPRRLAAEVRRRGRAHRLSARAVPGPGRRRAPGLRASRDAPGRAGWNPPPPIRGARFPVRFWMAIAIFVLFTLANSTDAFLLRAQESGIPLWQLPLLWAFFHAVKAAAGFPGGALADRIGRVRTIAPAGRSTRPRTSASPSPRRPSDLGALRALRSLLRPDRGGRARAGRGSGFRGSRAAGPSASSTRPSGWPRCPLRFSSDSGGRCSGPRVAFLDRRRDRPGRDESAAGVQAEGRQRPTGEF